MWARCLSIGLISFLLLATPYQTNGARILLLCINDIMNSHTLEMLALGEELVSRGHEVAIPICPHVMPPPPANSSKPTVQHLNYCAGQPPFNIFAHVSPKDMTKLTHKEARAYAQTLFAISIQRVLENTEFMQSLKDMTFDLAVVDGFSMAPFNYVIAHVLRLPYVTISSLNSMYFGGSPTIPSIHSNYLIQNINIGSFTYRLSNLWNHIDFAIFDRFYNKGQHLLTQFAPDVTSFQQLVDKSMMFFLTRDYMIDYPQPFFPNVVVTTPLMYSPSKPLSGDIEQVYSEATNGVIVVSFGSMPITAIDKISLDKLMAAFGQLQQTVVFKLKTNIELPEIPRNVKIFSWLPQNDCLGHERTKLFVAHGGANGLYEALYHGVPMIGFPFFGDQFYSLQILESRGCAILMDLHSFTTEDLVSKIRKIVTNTSYSANVKKASAILKDRPMTSRQTVAYWIEHVIKHGHQHLRPHVFDLAWYEYFMIDVFVFLMATFAFGAVLVYCSVRYAHGVILKLKHRHATKLKAN
jgi:UDP:flavonoid glycosyltransferase YjiC (YdhE family)